MDFVNAFLDNAFLRNAVIVGALASLACGIMGTYVVVRRISYISGGIAHSVLGGMGAAYFVGGQPLLGALAAAVTAAVIIGLVSLHAKEHEDTLIGAVWAIGMAVGIIFIYRTPGYASDLMSFLFGNILMAGSADLARVAVLDVIILAAVILFYRQFQAVCYDQEYARLRGVRAGLMYVLLLVLIALTVVLVIQVVGIILVIALLTLPASIASGYADSLGRMMRIAVGVSLAVTWTGLGIAYQADAPAGATIVLVAGFTYLAAELFRHRLRPAKPRTDRKTRSGRP